MLFVSRKFFQYALCLVLLSVGAVSTSAMADTINRCSITLPGRDVFKSTISTITCGAVQMQARIAVQNTLVDGIVIPRLHYLFRARRITPPNATSVLLSRVFTTPYTCVLSPTTSAWTRWCDETKLPDAVTLQSVWTTK